MKVLRLTIPRTGHCYRTRYAWYSLRLKAKARATERSEELNQWKIPSTTPGIETVLFRLVEQCLSELGRHVPHCMMSSVNFTVHRQGVRCSKWAGVIENVNICRSKNCRSQKAVLMRQLIQLRCWACSLTVFIKGVVVPSCFFVNNSPRLLYVFFWVIPRRLNSDVGELPRRKHTTFRTRRKFEIRNSPRVTWKEPKASRLANKG
jgi:hypothetical protein